LIDIAHPDHRDLLEEKARERFEKFGEVVLV
jgi:acyl-CoA hydrolase